MTATVQILIFIAFVIIMSFIMLKAAAEEQVEAIRSIARMNQKHWTIMTILII